MQEGQYYISPSLQWVIRTICIIAVIALGITIVYMPFKPQTYQIESIIVGVSVLVLASLWSFTYGPHVIVGDDYIQGAKYSGLFTFGTFNNYGFFPRGKLYYHEIGAIKEGSLFGVSYKRYISSAKATTYIIVFHCINDREECFSILNKKIEQAATKTTSNR